MEVSDTRKADGRRGRDSAFLKRLDASWERAIRQARRTGQAEDIHKQLEPEIPYKSRYSKRGITEEEFTAMYRAGVEFALSGTEVDFLPFMDEAFGYVEMMILSRDESRAVCGWMLEEDPLEWFDDDWEVREVEQTL